MRNELNQIDPNTEEGVEATIAEETKEDAPAAEGEAKEDEAKVDSAE